MKLCEEFSTVFFDFDSFYIFYLRHFVPCLFAILQL